MAAETRVTVCSDADIVVARQRGRSFAEELGLSLVDTTLVATAISELARNIVEYAKRGEIVFSVAQQGNRRCLVIVAQDQGPGIPNVDLAMQDGYSTSKSLGLGLPGVRRLMDEFEIVSEVGKGTTITTRKWAR